MEPGIDPNYPQLTALLGADAVLRPDTPEGMAALAGYAVDGVLPLAVARPSDRAGIAAVLRWAAAQDVAVLPRGGGVHSGLGHPPRRAGIVLDLSRCNRVLDYQPADLTATVEGGLTLAGMQRELAGGGKFIPLESPLPERATIGGILAANVSGPLRYAYGLPRDWLIGISVLDAEGIETKAGGQVVKNVTGYDLNKLYIGSLGTLGIIVAATFKLAPGPETWAALTAAYPTRDSGIAAGRALMAQLYAPQGMAVVNRPAARRLGLAITGPAAAYGLAFFAGRPRAVGRRREESARLLKAAGAGSVDIRDDAASQILLRRLTDLGWTDDTRPSLLLKINLPPAAVGEFVAAIAGMDSEDFWGIVADVGFGAVQLLRWGETGAEEDAALADTLAAIAALRERARALGGTAVVEHCPLAVKEWIDVWDGGAAGAAEMAIMRRIKANFDPAGRLNPGRFMGRL